MVNTSAEEPRVRRVLPPLLGSVRERERCVRRYAHAQLLSSVRARLYKASPIKNHLPMPLTCVYFYWEMSRFLRVYCGVVGGGGGLLCTGFQIPSDTRGVLVGGTALLNENIRGSAALLGQWNREWNS